MDNQNVKPYDLKKYTAAIAKEFDFAEKLNSSARQAAAERTAFAIKRFFDNCRDAEFRVSTGKKDIPSFKKATVQSNIN
ncbi:MAG: hypothetical protein N2235_10345 [Fischerella sp.]|nr:hypothetical protein [Fischerella sp.]